MIVGSLSSTVAHHYLSGTTPIYCDSDSVKWHCARCTSCLLLSYNHLAMRSWIKCTDLIKYTSIIPVNQMKFRTSLLWRIIPCLSSKHIRGVGSMFAHRLWRYHTKPALAQHLAFLGYTFIWYFIFLSRSICELWHPRGNSQIIAFFWNMTSSSATETASLRLSATQDLFLMPPKQWIWVV